MSLNPDALVVFRIGSNPARLFQEQGLSVYVDTTSLIVEESIKKLLTNKLQKLESNGTYSVH